MVLYQKHDWKRPILLFLFPCKVAAVFDLQDLSFLSFLVLFKHFLIITIKFYLFLQRIISCINTSFKLKFNDGTSSKKKKKFTDGTYSTINYKMQKLENNKVW